MSKSLEEETEEMMKFLVDDFGEYLSQAIVMPEETTETGL